MRKLNKVKFGECFHCGIKWMCGLWKRDGEVILRCPECVEGDSN